MRKFNKKKLPSRHTSLGADRAPHRSFYYAMGETEKDVSKPFVGVVSTWNEAAPCNIALMRQAQSVKKLGRINNFYEKDQQKPSATLVISGDIFKIYFDENVDLNLIKENLVKRQGKYQEEMDKISQRLSNKGFTDRAPKNIVEQEKTNYSNLKDDIKKISLTIESL